MSRVQFATASFNAYCRSVTWHRLKDTNANESATYNSIIEYREPVWILSTLLDYEQ